MLRLHEREQGVVATRIHEDALNLGAGDQRLHTASRRIHSRTTNRVRRRLRRATCVVTAAAVAVVAARRGSQCFGDKCRGSTEQSRVVRALWAVLERGVDVGHAAGEHSHTERR